MFPHTNAYSSAFRQCPTKPLAPWQHPEFLYPHNKDYVVLKNRANNSIQNICHTLKYSKSSNIWYAREIFLFCFHASLSNPSEQITTGYMEYKFKWAKLYAQSLERAHLQDRRPLCPGDSPSLQTSIPSASCLFHLLMLRLLTSWTDIAGLWLPKVSSRREKATSLLKLKSEELTAPPLREDFVWHKEHLRKQSKAFAFQHLHPYPSFCNTSKWILSW